MQPSQIKMKTLLTPSIFLLFSHLSNHNVQAKTKSLRVFQTLPLEPSEMDHEELMRNIRATQARVFGDRGE